MFMSIQTVMLMLIILFHLHIQQVFLESSQVLGIILGTWKKSGGIYAIEEIQTIKITVNK